MARGPGRDPHGRIAPRCRGKIDNSHPRTPLRPKPVHDTDGAHLPATLGADHGPRAAALGLPNDQGPTARVGSSTISQVRFAISPARRPPLMDSSTITRLRSGYRVAAAKARRLRMWSSVSNFACLPAIQIASLKSNKHDIERFTRSIENSNGRMQLIKKGAFLNQSGRWSVTLTTPPGTGTAVRIHSLGQLVCSPRERHG